MTFGLIWKLVGLTLICQTGEKHFFSIHTYTLCPHAIQFNLNTRHFLTLVSYFLCHNISKSHLFWDTIPTSSSCLLQLFTWSQLALNLIMLYVKVFFSINDISTQILYLLLLRTRNLETYKCNQSVSSLIIEVFPNNKLRDL